MFYIKRTGTFRMARRSQRTEDSKGSVLIQTRQTLAGHLSEPHEFQYSDIIRVLLEVIVTIGSKS
jgi:hypothetical protein